MYTESGELKRGVNEVKKREKAKVKLTKDNNSELQVMKKKSL